MTFFKKNVRMGLTIMNIYDIMRHKKTEVRRRKMCKKAVMTIRSTEYTMDDIDKAVNLILSDYKTTSSVPIVKILNDAGFRILLQDLPKNTGGYIMMNGDCLERFGSDKIIVLNNSNNANRRRFTLAHEFGHFLLDPNARNVSEFYDAHETDDDNDSTEQLVSKFAAKLLMPDKLFSKKYNALKKKNIEFYDICIALMDFFEVPYKAVTKRIIELGL